MNTTKKRIPFFSPFPLSLSHAPDGGLVPFRSQMSDNVFHAGACLRHAVSYKFQNGVHFRRELSILLIGLVEGKKMRRVRVNWERRETRKYIIITIRVLLFYLCRVVGSGVLASVECRRVRRASAARRGSHRCALSGLEGCFLQNGQWKK